ncbi:ATP-binding protein [Streptomyces sp. NPDC048611]|uniref:ATP-binding protein n=1 Tax=Streptomyces sp. NPDC048611 TaxID=3155635 RepID=UPI003438ACFC
MAVRDYEDDDAEFTAGIDEQLDVVRQWWPADGAPAPFLHIPAPELKQRRDIEDFLEDHQVREMTGKALVLFVTGHGISSGSRIHFLKLPGTQKGRVLATAVRTSDIVMAALDSHVENVLVIVNTCYAGQLAAELGLLHTEIGRGRRRACQLDVLVTCGHDQPVQVRRFPSLMRGVFHRLRTTSQITAPYLTVAELMAEVERELATPDQRELHQLRRVIGNGQTAPSPCLPNPGYRPVRRLVGVGREQVATDADDYWLDRATGRTQDDDSGWYFSGREDLNRQVAGFLATAGAGVLLLTGTTGSGKSAILARAVTLSDPRFLRDATYAQAVASAPAGTVPPPCSVTTAVLARHRGPADVVHDLLTGLGQAPCTPRTPEESDDPVPSWTEQLTTYVSTCREPVTIVLDGLDEAHEPHRIIHSILAPLSPLCRPPQPAPAPRLPGPRTPEPGPPALRLLIGVRSGLPDPPRRVSGAGAEADGLLESLLQVFPGCRSARTDDSSSQNDIAAYVHALICDDGDHPGAEKASEAVASEVWPSFADARLAGEQLRAVEDPEAEVATEQWRTTVRAGTTGLLRRDLMLLEAEKEGEDGKKLPADVALALLRASAWAQGGGVPWSDIWPAMASAILQRPVENPDTMIKKLLESRLAGYLAWGVEDNRRVYRPAHEVVARTLRDPNVEQLLYGETP